MTHEYELSQTKPATTITFKSWNALKHKKPPNPVNLLTPLNVKSTFCASVWLADPHPTHLDPDLGTTALTPTKGPSVNATMEPLDDDLRARIEVKWFSDCKEWRVQNI